MKVLVVNNMAPFLWGGAEELAEHLHRNLIRAGHDSEILRLPFQWEPASGIIDQMMLARGIELTNVDRVIALKFPAYLIRHPAKTLWILHQYRQAYDLFDAGESNIADDDEGAKLRGMIKAADEESFRSATQVFTNSEVTRQRMLKYNGFDASVLLPPVNDPELFGECDEGGTYVFAGGRINDLKRQHLLIDALGQTPSHVKLIIAGPADSPADVAKLHLAAKRARVTDRLLLDIRFLPRETYAKYVREAAAVAYLPFDEDSLGYVAMEAATAGKPLITTTDSGGVQSLVLPETTGWLAEPNAASLSLALQAVFRDPKRSKAYGAAAKELWGSFKVTWPETIERLLR